MSVDSPGGKCWFSVDSKTFEISIEKVKEKVLGKICERGPNFSLWIRFGGKGLALLVEGVETSCVMKDGEPFRKVWVEGGRHYLLELCSNRAGWFLFCSVWSVEEKRFSLAFHEGGGFLRGWKILSSKLRSLGVSSTLQREEDPFAYSRKVLAPSEDDERKKGLVAEARSCSFAEHCNVVWIEVEKEVLDKNEEFLKRSLVGEWRGPSDQPLDLCVLRNWAQSS